MHIPDGFVIGPVNLACAGVAVAACDAALARTRRTLGARRAPLLGMTAAFVFAAQMLNFPVAAGTSGHFLGAAFAAMLLGPWAACLVLALVLAVQCLLFADGGITALGTNIVNMAMIGVGAGYGATRLLTAILPRTRAAGMAAVAIGAWISVVAAGAACAVELVLSGQPAGMVLPALLGIHALIGIGEALITAAAVTTVLAARPDLLPGLPALMPPALIRQGAP